MRCTISVSLSKTTMICRKRIFMTRTSAVINAVLANIKKVRKESKSVCRCVVATYRCNNGISCTIIKTEINSLLDWIANGKPDRLNNRTIQVGIGSDRNPRFDKARLSSMLFVFSIGKPCLAPRRRSTSRESARSSACSTCHPNLFSELKWGT